MKQQIANKVERNKCRKEVIQKPKLVMYAAFYVGRSCITANLVQIRDAA
jgi:hypothetical protein